MSAIPLGCAVDPPTVEQASTSEATSTSGGPTIDEPPPGTTTMSPPGSMSTSSSEASSGDSSSSGLPDLPDPKYDIGVPDAPEPVTGCTGVDFLFVIDNSGSMAAFQEVVLDSVDAFIAALDSRITGVDSFHFGVVTSDAYALNSAGCQGLGDLVTQTAAGDCGPFADGERFATDADDLTDVLPCMLQVGTMGSPIEEPASAAVAAVSPANALPGACNEGFLRDDAILAVILVTDDPPFDADLDDAHPDTDPSPWAPAILEAKDGEDGAVVVLGFIPWDDVSCVPFGLESPNLIEFVDGFGSGTKVSVCEPDFGPALDEAMAAVDTACAALVP